MAKKHAHDFRENPLEKANIFSVMSFWWLNDIFSRGQKHDLNQEDQYRLLKDDTSQVVCERLERNWENELRCYKETGKQPSLFRAIVKTFFVRWLLLGIVEVMEQTLFVAQPVLLANLLRYFENKATLQSAYLYAAGIFAIALATSSTIHIYLYQLKRMGWHIRISTCALMYKKTLKLSQRALGDSTTGQIVNLGATDVLRFDLLTPYLHFLWLTPIVCGVVVYLLWQSLGPSSMAALVVMLSVLFIQGSLAKRFGEIRAKMAILTDERIRTMNEVITAMRIIKMYTWEKPFEKLVREVRRKEIAKVLSASTMKACIYALVLVSHRLFVFATFSLYVTFGGRLTPSKVFSAVGFFSSIRLSLGTFLPMAIEKVSESLVSIRRIQEFLLLDEFDVSQRSNEDDLGEVPSAISVQFTDFSASWSLQQDDPNQNENTLSNVSARVDSSELFAVIGPVGSGKSSFLSAILRELPPTTGEVKVVGRVAYVGQVPWIFSGTIRENILFGETYDEIRYKKVIECCALTVDIKSLEKGDETLVGERGVTLSGGQKARVNLARAAYRKNTDIILMDDPLSAVDSNVANQLFHQCICDFLKDKVRILVTHQVQFLTVADQIIILKNGKITGHGTFDQLQTDGTDFASLLKTDYNEEEKEEEIDSVSGYLPSPTSPLLASGESRFFNIPLDNEVAKTQADGEPIVSFSQSVRRRKSQRKRESQCSNKQKHGQAKEGQAEFVASIEEEETRVQGSIGWRVYAEYLNTNKMLLALLAILILVNHSLFLVCDWWISVWSSKSVMFYSTQPISNNVTSSVTTTVTANATSQTSTVVSGNSSSEVAGVAPGPQFDNSFYIKILGILTLVFITILFARAILQFYYTIITGRKMHDKMFHAILQAPIRFFDINPVGRILNRFSKDTGQIDEILPLTLMDFVFVFFTILSILILVVAINYFVLIAVVPLCIFFVWLRRFYIRTSRDIKRMEGASRSPVFSHLSTTIQGLTTIRAFRMQNEFATEFHELQDLHSCSWFLFLNCSQWLALRLDVISAIFIGTVSLSSVLTASILTNDAGLVGLTLAYSISLNGLFQWCVRQSTEVENLEYYKIPPEAAHELSGNKPPGDWPNQGIIAFDNLTYAHYQGGPDVLHEIRLEIRSNEKIGVVGRTGAGKSSLISAMFRLNEFKSGEICIDGVAASSLGLADLRSVISVIPQDPILFAGSLRQNLDPFVTYTDEELWDALEQVQLKPLIENFPAKLEYEVSEAGGNFSVGQKQLICLARAILSKTKILIVDEATANVDMRTDQLIQLTLRSTFKNCTVITVAHRINTIIDSDRVMVLEAGRVVEFDEPHNLLSKTKGVFMEMVDSVGIAESRQLKDSARKVYEHTHNSGTYVETNPSATSGFASLE